VDENRHDRRGDAQRRDHAMLKRKAHSKETLRPLRSW
jgi:hypothetical protein